MSPPTLRIGFLGAGKMATALAKGFSKSGLVPVADLCASDIHVESRNTFARETGAAVFAHNAEILNRSSVVFVAVKPDQVDLVLSGIAAQVNPVHHLLISIAAGVTLTKLEALTPPSSHWVRVMPNTPALIGASASAYAVGTHASRADAEIVQRLLAAVGLALEVKEKLLDAVTGLSGSGPAYGFVMIEALADGGVAAGLPRDVAQKLAAQTLLGAARMVLETGQHPAALKDAVCSPGGTTIEAIHELEKGGIRAALISAVRAAADKARRLG